MRAAFDFDPTACDYGPGTLSVRRILRAWASVDWFSPFSQFSPSSGTPDKKLAISLFEEHLALARAFDPKSYPERMDVRAEVSGWPAFEAYCKRVRDPSSEWDWRYAGLKMLNHNHSVARGWDVKSYAEGIIRSRGGVISRPGDLVIAVGDMVIWAVNSRLELKDALPKEYTDTAYWYYSYAYMDFMDCIQWQLAEKSDRMDTNPFVPLTRCYDAGFYPFCLSRSSVVLWAFGQ